MYLNCPINSVSFGQVSYNLLFELFKRGEDVNLFPIGNTDLSSFEMKQDFALWLNLATQNARDNWSLNEGGFKLWHISGLMESYGKRRCAMTFHETDRLTPTEINILNSLDVVFVTSNYTKEVFEAANVKCEVVYCPLGFDSENFKKTGDQTYNDGRIAWGLFGKMEKRKSTLKVMQTWAKKYGNNKDHVLHVAITNPFLNQEVQKQMIAAALGKNYFNINFLPFLSKNEQYNQILNSIDIDLTGMSLCEGFNLPAFQCLCLGKQGVFLDAHVHKDYAKEGGAIMVQPYTQIEAVDGIFFKNGEKFNQGYWSDFKEDDLASAMEEGEKVAKNTNTLGEKLPEKFNYKKTTDIILSNI